MRRRRQAGLTGTQREETGVIVAGRALLKALIDWSEAEQVWTLQAGIFAVNTPSIALHEACGFRRVGVRERLSKMTYGPHKDEWLDIVLIERRSRTVGVD